MDRAAGEKSSLKYRLMASINLSHSNLPFAKGLSGTNVSSATLVLIFGGSLIKRSCVRWTCVVLL